MAGAGKAVSENILQPGLERVRAEAPGVQQRLGVFAGEAGKRIGEVHGIVREKTGVDVQEGWGSLMGKMRDMNVGGNQSHQGYEGVSDGWGEHTEETSALYRDDDGAEGDDFFQRYEKDGAAPLASAASHEPMEAPAPAKPVNHVEKEGWDDWKDF